MTQISLGRLNQVGNQVVPALELNVDLAERRLEPILKRHKGVVGPGQPEQGPDDNQCDDAQDAPNTE